jgi:hypothetical protein
MDVEKRIEEIERRLSILEGSHGLAGETGDKSVELDLVLPEAEIDGLRFNEQKAHAVFEKKEDGWYYSRDILFLSARNIDDDNSRDILAEYLNLSGDGGIKEQLADYFDVHPQDIEISLPEKTMGAKKYNGVRWWYWLASPHSGHSHYFAIVYSDGSPSRSNASLVGGVAPAFRVV